MSYLIIFQSYDDDEQIIKVQAICLIVVGADFLTQPWHTFTRHGASLSHGILTLNVTPHTVMAY